MEHETELAQLKQEVARLREEMRQLTRFIHYHPAGEDDDGKPLAEHLSIICWNITMLDPRAPGKTQINLTASPSGPSIGLFDCDEKCRISLSADADGPEINLLRENREYAVTVRDEKGAPSVDGQSRRPRDGGCLSGR